MHTVLHCTVCGNEILITNQHILFAVSLNHHFPRYRPGLYRRDQLQQEQWALQGGVLEAPRTCQLTRSLHLWGNTWWAQSGKSTKAYNCMYVCMYIYTKYMYICMYVWTYVNDWAGLNDGMNHIILSSWKSTQYQSRLEKQNEKWGTTFSFAHLRIWSSEMSLTPLYAASSASTCREYLQYMEIKQT